MLRPFQPTKGYRVVLSLCLALGAFTPWDLAAEAKPTKQLYHNEDCTNFFVSRELPEGRAGEIADQYVDVMAEAGVTVFLCNTNARRTNYRSDAWQAFWDGYDPDGPDDQPFLKPVPQAAIAGYRKWVGRMLTMHKQGVDYPDRVVKRCRERGISPWITLRMNDCHENDKPVHPFHGRFWKENPQFCLKNRPGYFARCLDYAHPEVRDKYKALIVETLDRYDIDGLELDFMREPYVFSAGEEAAGRPIMTEWIREIRKLTAQAAAKRGHPVRLGVRVPSRPETAFGLGLDAVTWAKEGLIDVLVATPRWATLEFEIPIQQWREKLGDSKVTLLGGIEVRYHPGSGATASLVSPELATGAAMSVLSQGADAVYLFNYFQSRHPGWSEPVYLKTLQAMASLDTLRQLPRRVGVTYRDIVAEGEKYRPPLPATGKELVFPMTVGPLPDGPSVCEVTVGLAASKDATSGVPAISVNNKPCEVLNDDGKKEGTRVIVYRVPTTALASTEPQQVKVACTDQNALTIQRVEVSVEPRK